MYPFIYSLHLHFILINRSHAGGVGGGGGHLETCYQGTFRTYLSGLLYPLHGHFKYNQS